MATKFSCQICGHDELVPVDGFAALSRVTSDCKPWSAGGELTTCAACGALQKLPSDKWLREIGEIYGAYQIYQLADGAEQPIFAADGSAAPRSHTLVDYVVRSAGLGDSGRLIDIGCGNGAALANFAAALPGWRLSGSELSDKALPRLRRLPSFDTLYTTSLRDIPYRFDVVTMIHSLEHMPSAHEALEEARSLVAADGRLFVEVPNAATSPFDLLVADHLSHFTPRHLHYLAGRSGLVPTDLRDDVLPKEISMLARPGAGEGERPNPDYGRSLALTTVAWLHRVMAAAAVVADRAKTAGRPFGIFGTSISGMWLFGGLRDGVSFFVDEDRMRVGASFEGRPVLAPADIASDAVVFIPLVPEVARRVAARHASGPGQYELPPVMASGAGGIAL